MEIWWDSSPLIFKAWAKKMIDKASDEEREHLKEQLKTLFNIFYKLDNIVHEYIKIVDAFILRNCYFYLTN